MKHLCYTMGNVSYEVKKMEHEHLNEQAPDQSVVEETTVEEPVTEETSAEKPAYTPRPAAQVWLARIGLVLFILVVILYYLQMFRGGK